MKGLSPHLPLPFSLSLQLFLCLPIPNQYYVHL